MSPTMAGDYVSDYHPSDYAPARLVRVGVCATSGPAAQAARVRDPVARRTRRPSPHIENKRIRAPYGLFISL